MPVVGGATYARDDLGLLSQITDLNGSHWTFGYTNMGRLQSKTDPLGNTHQYGYDSRGRLSTITYPGGETATRTYDAAGNVTRILYSGGLDIQNTFNPLNQLLTTNNLTFSRDDEGRIISTENPGVVFGATYDDGGRLKTVTYDDNAFAVTYSYDSATGLLSRVADSLTNTQIDFAYDNDRRMTGITRSNGANTTLTWDDADRLTRIQDGTIIDLQYTLNETGQVAGVDMTAPLDPATLLIGGTDTFTYDAASQIRTCTWNNASRWVGNDSASAAFSYNGLGDLITRTESGQTIHYYYNYAIGLTPIVAESVETGGHGVTATRRQTEEQLFFTASPGHPLAASEFNRYYVWTPAGRLLYMIDAANGNKVYFYHFDRTGSTLALTDSAGTVTDKYAYDPYGELLGHQGNNGQPFTFVGQWGVRQEGDSGVLYHMRARYYDALAQRFMSRDPLWPQTTGLNELNPYQYVANSPLTRVDPTGKGGWAWLLRVLNWMSGTPTGYAEGDPEWGRFGSPIGDDKELFKLFEQGRKPINEGEARRIFEYDKKRIEESFRESERRRIREEDELKLMDAGLSPAEAEAFMNWLEKQHFGAVRAQREFDSALEFLKHKGKRNSVNKVKGVWVGVPGMGRMFFPGAFIQEGKVWNPREDRWMTKIEFGATETDPEIFREGLGPAEGFKQIY